MMKSMSDSFYTRRSKLVPIFTCLILLSGIGKCQTPNLYPPFTKWYQDPLGLKPIQLSTAFGFVCGSVAVATSLFLTKNDSSFQKKVSIYWEGGYGFGYKPPYTNVFQNDIGIMYNVRQWMTTGLGLNSFYFGDHVNNTWTTGIMPFVRWYLYQSNTTKLFFQYGAGISYSMKRFPSTGTGWEADTGRTGTKFNFLAKYGVGMEIQFKKQLSLQYGVRHFHLSNGNIAGIKRNPSHDSNAFFAGFIYRLR